MGKRFTLQGWVHEVALTWRGSSSSKKEKKKFKLIGMNVFNHLINILTYYDFLKVQLQGYIIY